MLPFSKTCLNVHYGTHPYYLFCQNYITNHYSISASDTCSGLWEDLFILGDILALSEPI